MALTKFNFNSFDVTSAASKGLGFNASANGFSTVDPGAMTLIKTLTASSSSTLSFVDGSSSVVLDNTYPVYLFKFISLHPASNDYHFMLNFSIDSGSNYNVTKTTTYFRARHKENDATTELGYQTVFDVAQSTGDATIFDSVSTDNDASWSGEMYLFNPSSTTFIKHFMSRIQGMSNSPLSNDVYCAGYCNTTSAVDGVKFLVNSGNIDAGTIKLYGIKDS
tara:strand:+ start:1555 stop:2217 length:663 start_codon:yes stop_codon:yes gene_type:complete